MKSLRLNVLAVAGMVGVLISCSSNQPKHQIDFQLPEEFGSYWYQGQAELAKYNLQQVRYGEMREGQAVLIFVTEDFSKSKQVKLDNQGEGLDDVLKVMKLNAMRKFNTGIYPYSTMTSAFTPIYLNEDPQSVKLTTSVQEWCGQSFIQANLAGQNYRIQSNSYFESEGDMSYTVASVLMEDELWNRVRLNPAALPTGSLEMLPSTLYCRFMHKAFAPTPVEAQLTESGGDSRIYQLAYTQLDRTLKIEFEKNFPHRIVRWEESYPDGGEIMTTRAELDTAIQLDYWDKNSKADAHFRQELGLE